MNRRQYLTRAVSVGTLGVLSGCAERDRGDGGPGEGDRSPFFRYIESAENYDGIVDLRGKEEVVVDVGVPAEGEFGTYAFDPPGIMVDIGTTVIWKWVGNGEHNVVAEIGAEFESELTADSDYEFRFTLETRNNIRYYCVNHRWKGMFGGIMPD
jgi:halocyanin-like protein